MKKWLENNTASLSGKTVAVTGSTGGLGSELCTFLAKLGASLILIDRNAERSESFAKRLMNSYGVSVKCINADLGDISQVKSACERLKHENLDVFIHNAGAYSIPRHKCASGVNNVFQINFLSPYYMIKELLPSLSERNGRVVAVGSIAHGYSKADTEDVDFSTRNKASKVYGNAKRYLMFSLHELFKGEERVTLSVVHPGISFTNITAHYPKLIFAIIKEPMKVIFMKPRKACLSILKGVFEPCAYLEWIGPRFFNVWGYPSKKRLKTASDAERAMIFCNAEKLYGNMRTLLN